MEFKTSLNDAKVAIEYDEDLAADQDGAVNECEVMYQGKNITQTVHHEQYWAYLIDCEAHYKKHMDKQAQDHAYDHAAERCEAREAV